MAELHSYKSIDEGVQATPEKGHALGDIGGVEQTDVVVTVLSTPLRRDDCGPKQDQVVGHLTQQEDGHHCQNHLNGLVPLKVTSLAEGLHDAAVAEAHNEERKNESQNNLAGLDAQLVRASGERCAGFVGDGGVHQIRYGEDERRDPDGHRRNLADKHGPGSMAVSTDRFGDGKVAIHADEAEQEHAAVEADFVNGVHGFAHGQAQHPPWYWIEHPEREREREQKIGKGQVEQVHVRHGLQTLEVEEGQYDQHVPRQAQDKDDGVEGGHEPEAEISVGLFHTDRWKIFIIHTGVVVLWVVHGWVFLMLRQAHLWRRQMFKSRTPVCDSLVLCWTSLEHSSSFQCGNIGWILAK